MSAAENTHTLSLRLDAEEYERVRTLAFLTKRSINQVIRDSIRAHVSAGGREEAVAAAIELVRTEHRGILDKLA
jgi:predicted transcriptional regulator